MYKVVVASNARYQDEDEWYTKGEYQSSAEALAVCRRLVEASYEECGDLAGYQSYGEDPFIVCVAQGAEDVRFSAWTYAKELSEAEAALVS